MSDHPDPVVPEPVVPDPAAETSAAARGIDWPSLLRNIGLGLAVLLMVWLAFNVRLPSVDQLHEQLDRWGGFAWLAFTLLYVVVAVTPIPVTIMAIAGGVLFGVAEGSVLSVIGSLAGGWVAYWLARLLGRATVTKLLGRHAAAVEARLANAGSSAVYLLRLTPGLPYWAVNYGSGAFGVTQRAFLLGSVLGTIPGQVSLVAIGAFITEPSLGAGIVVGIAWAVVLVLTFLAYRDLRRTTKAARADTA